MTPIELRTLGDFRREYDIPLGCLRAWEPGFSRGSSTKEWTVMVDHTDPTLLLSKICICFTSAYEELPGWYEVPMLNSRGQHFIGSFDLVLVMIAARKLSMGPMARLRRGDVSHSNPMLLAFTDEADAVEVALMFNDRRHDRG